MVLEPAQCLFLAALVTGLASQPLPAGGLWTGVGAFALAALWMDGLAPAAALLIGCVGLLVSALRAPRPRGLMIEAGALLLAALAIPWWASALLYWLGGFLGGQLMAGRLKGQEARLWRSLALENALAAAANMAVALVLAQAFSPLIASALVAVQLISARGRRNFAYRLQSGAARATLHELENTEQNLLTSERAGQALRHQVQVLSWLSEALRELAGRLKVDDILLLLQALTERLCQQQATIVHWQGQQRAWGNPSPELTSQLKWVLEQQTPVRSDTVLCVPLTLGREVHGAIALQRSHPAWDDSHLQSVLALCRGAGVSLSNASLFAQLEAQQRELLETQAQLVQSGKLRAVGQMAAGIAHELNSPLGAVYMNLEMVCQQAPENLKKRLERALGATQRARTIIEKLLNHSRPAASEERLDLSRVVREGLDFVEPQCSPVGLHCQQLESVWVAGRGGEIQQILTNLVLNARDACVEAGVAEPLITVGCRREGSQAVLWVSDNGRGVEPEVAGRLFDPFFTTKEPGRGTGLGLWTSQEIARSHQGTLSFESQPGQGTRFYLHLPVAGD